MRALAIGVVLLAIPCTGHCDVPVIDLAGLTQSLKSYYETARQTVMQNEIVANTLQTVHTAQGILHDTTGTLQQVTGLYNSVTGVRSIGQAFSALNGQLGDPLPGVYAVEGLLNARTPQGALGGLGALGTAFGTQQRLNTVYLDPNPAAAQSMTDRITNTSASQAIGERHLADAQGRMPAITGLVDELQRAKDPADRENIAIRLAGVQASLQASTLESLSASQMSLAAEKAQMLRQQQLDQKSVAEFAQQQLAAAGR